MFLHNFPDFTVWPVLSLLQGEADKWRGKVLDRVMNMKFTEMLDQVQKKELNGKSRKCKSSH